MNRIKSFGSAPSKLFLPDSKMLVVSSSDPLPLNKRSTSVFEQGEKNHGIILPNAQKFISVPANIVQSSQLDLGRHAKAEASTRVGRLFHLLRSLSLPPFFFFYLLFIDGINQIFKILF